MSTTTRTVAKRPVTRDINKAHEEALAEDAKRTGSSQRQLQAAGSKPGGRTKGKLSFHEAAVEVLREQGPMHLRALTDEILKRKLASTKGKTPTATMATILLRGSHDKGVFVKVDPGTYDLRELNPRGAKKRPRS